MGGFKGLAYDLADKVAGDFVRGFKGFATEETGAYGFARSAEALLNRSPQGKTFSEYLKNTFAPKIGQMGQQILDTKIAAGMNPEQAARESSREAYQQARKLYIGNKDEALIKMVHSVGKTHGSIYANAVADAMSVYFSDAGSYWRKRKIPVYPGATQSIKVADVGVKGLAEYRAPGDIEHNLRRAISWMYTPLIAIPHTAQVGNIILDNVNTPVKAVARAMKEYFSTGVTRQKFTADVIRSGALFDELRYQIMEDANSKGTGGTLYKLFNHPGFGFIRRQEISMAAVVGKHAAMEAADRLSANPSDRWARHALNKLGVDVNQLAQNGYNLTQDDIYKAMYNEANRTIFFRDRLQTPWRWEESFVARMASQYRHFQFRQTKFLVEAFKDAYKEKGSVGLAKAIGTFGILFPVFGELVHSLENMAVGHSPLERDPKSQFGGNEYIDALAHAAGFGIFYSISRSGMWNGGRGFLEGPLLTTAEDILIGIPRDVKQGKYKQATRKLVSKFGAPGRFIGEQMRESEKAEKGN